jgi:uncharacterized protein with beta-barrel porin domain
VASAINAGDVGSGLAQALLSLSASGAQQSFDALSGEIYASSQSVMLTDNLYLLETVLERMRQASFTGGIGPMAARASGGPTLATVKTASSTAPETTFWAQGTGAWGSFDGDGNAAHLAGYLAAHSGPWNLRTAAASFSDPDVNRSMVFPGFVGTATADNSASTALIFGEVGYGVAVGQVALEPFAGLAYVHLNTDSFSETGGAGFANGLLSGSDSIENIGYSTLRGRAATNSTLTCRRT